MPFSEKDIITFEVSELAQKQAFNAVKQSAIDAQKSCGFGTMFKWIEELDKAEEAWFVNATNDGRIIHKGKTLSLDECKNSKGEFKTSLLPRAYQTARSVVSRAWACDIDMQDKGKTALEKEISKQKSKPVEDDYLKALDGLNKFSKHYNVLGEVKKNSLREELEMRLDCTITLNTTEGE